MGWGLATAGRWGFAVLGECLQQHLAACAEAGRCLPRSMQRWGFVGPHLTKERRLRSRSSTPQKYIKSDRKKKKREEVNSSLRSLCQTEIPTYSTFKYFVSFRDAPACSNTELPLCLAISLSLLRSYPWGFPALARSMPTNSLTAARELCVISGSWVPDFDFMAQGNFKKKVWRLSHMLPTLFFNSK